MSLELDLLRHARELAERAPKRPKQANIRRAISAAYYAVFHLLTRAAARHFVGEFDDLIGRVARTFGHAEMAKVSKEFQAGKLPQLFFRKIEGEGAVLVSERLKKVAERFVTLQQARHTADYDSLKVYGRDEALTAVSEAELLFQSWSELSDTVEANIYLTSFHLWDTWNKPPR